mmetsp:Transcript_14059/g.18334  ORF Transcript_14059/g.18334 Transcript_14059/m.18334 type:complete len:340 (-) Transcript_14059:127-1146(-)
MIKALGSSKQVLFALTAVALGGWAFKTVNEISGPAFEPIIAACTDSSISIEDFAEKTGYHEWEPIVGLGAFNILVCLITQFLFELRNTPPAGILVWTGVIVVAFPFGVLAVVEAGRAGAKGPLRYPLILGLLYQLFGVSVMMPLVWIPSYIYGRGDGGVSVTRAIASVPMSLPGLILTIFVFTADTDSYLWTVCAGILGGPGVPMIVIALWGDSPPEYSANDANIKGTKAVAMAYRVTLPIALITWVYVVYAAYSAFGTDTSALCRALWTDANASVAFMTIDTLILFAAMVIFLAFRSWTAAIKTLLLAPLMGPGAACCLTLAELEEASPPVSTEKKIA